MLAITRIFNGLVSTILLTTMPSVQSGALNGPERLGFGVGGAKMHGLWQRMFSIMGSVVSPKSALPRSPVQVGWFFHADRHSVIFFGPERFRSVDTNRRHAKSAARCPAVISLESRYFVIKCPFDISIRFVRGPNNEPKLLDLLGDESSVRPKELSQYLSLTPEREWRYPDRPTIQLMLPYVFISDEPVYLNQVPPFMHLLESPWPRTLFGGRFPIDIWPRPLMWAFEWQCRVANRCRQFSKGH
jgi:hypothetical protein